MRRQFGVLLQFAVLLFLPLLIFWQIDFGIPLIVMPAALVVSSVVFWIGYRLRES